MRTVSLKSNTKYSLNKLLFLLMVVMVSLLTVGYSSLNEEIKISGDAKYRVDKDIRLTEISLEEANNGVEDYASEYTKDSISVGLTLNELTSTVKYKVRITNKSNVKMKLTKLEKIAFTNNNITYDFSEKLPLYINKQSEIYVTITFRYKNLNVLPVDKGLNAIIKFNFEKVDSILSSSWFSSEVIKRGEIEQIDFQSSIEIPDNVSFWDASQNHDESVIAWYTDNDENDLYELVIAGEGEVIAPENSEGLFYGFTNLKEINFNDILNTENVNSMRKMFFGCSNITKLNLKFFDISNVTNMYEIFWGCSELTKLDLPSCTLNITDMSYMFFGCSSLASLNLSVFDAKKVTNMSHMLQNCSGLIKLDLPLNVTNVTDMSSMFYNCSSLTELDLRPLNTKNVTNMSGMFSGCKGLTSIDLSLLNTELVTNMSSMFYGCSGLTELDLTPLNTSKVTSMASMFNSCSGLTELDLHSLITENVIDMSNMFTYCSKLAILNVSSFNTELVTDMYRMFRGCSKLKNLDLSSFTFDKVNSYSSMFDSVVPNLPITVKDEASKEWLTDRFSNLTNIQVAESI